MTAPFVYPEAPLGTRHRPKGYADYLGFRDWVRDEFDFRCVYCLLREPWVPGGFHLDHFLPVAVHPAVGNEYTNLVYACATCNTRKGRQIIPDPRLAFTANQVEVTPDGFLRARTAAARRIARELRLNNPKYQEFRRFWIAVTAAVEEAGEPVTILGYPERLPNLKRLRPPGGNDRPEGLAESAYARRKAGTLPATY